MTPEQIQLVRDSWQLAKPFIKKAPALFYDRVFELNPKLKPLFKGDIQYQGLLFVGMVNTAVNALDDLDSVIPAVEDLGRRHVAYGVNDEDYETFQNALLWTLERSLANHFPPETRKAWDAMYTVLADTMKTAAAKLDA